MTDTPDLFPVAETLSPRLQWLRGIKLDIAAMEPAERLALREDLFGQYCDACCGEATCQCWNDA